MTTRLTFPASMFSVVCRRCGSTVRKSADSCPNCGADRSATFGHRRGAGPAQARPRGGMFEQQAAAPLASAATAASGAAGAKDDATAARSDGPGRWDAKRASERIAQRAAEHRARRVEESARSIYADPSNDPDALPGSENWSRNKTVAAGACALALLAGGIVYLQHGSDDSTAPSADQSVSGAIDSALGPFGRGATDAPSAPATPSPQAQAPARNRAGALASGDPLRGLRMALDQRDLTLARARLGALPAQQQARPEFEALSEELAKRELQRDAALQLARACERTSAWACVQQNAAEALALDGSNPESQAMLEHVITHAGWLVATPQGVRKAPGSADTAAKPAAPASDAVAASPAPASAQANVAAAASATLAAAAPKPAPGGHAAQHGRNATAAGWAARQAALDEARGQTEYLSRAEKIARAQAATDAVVAATILAPASAPAATAPSVSTATAARTAPSAPTSPAATIPPVAAAETAAPATAAPSPAPQASPARTPAPAATARAAVPNNGMYVAPSAQNGMYVAPSMPDDMYVAPAAPGGMYVAPATRPAPAPAQRPAPNGAQSSALPASMQLAAALSAVALPAATQAPAAQAAVALPAVTLPAAAHAPSAGAVLNATATAAKPATAQQPSAAAVTAIATVAAASGAAGHAATPLAASSAAARFDAQKADDVERAIKQYGWSAGETTPQPPR